MKLRKSSERGHFDHGWLNTYHTFSFGQYQDRDHMGFRALRVMNEDCVMPGQGFGTHGHRDMEIISYVLDGALEHKDSMGNGSVLRPGAFQRISAGTGIEHSEFNPSDSEPVHFYQIWLTPDRADREPGYEQKGFAENERCGHLRLVASPDGSDESLTIHQDAKVYFATLEHGTVITYKIAGGRHAWLQAMRGKVRLNDLELCAGDGAAVSDEEVLPITGVDGAEVMLFDLS